MKEALLTTCSRLLVTETRKENILTHRKETSLLSSPIPLELPPLDPSSHSHIHGVRGRGDPSPGKGSSLLLSPSPKLLWFPTMSVDSAWVPSLHWRPRSISHPPQHHYVPLSPPEMIVFIYLFPHWNLISIMVKIVPCFL